MQVKFSFQEPQINVTFADLTNLPDAKSLSFCFWTGGRYQYDINWGSKGGDYCLFSVYDVEADTEVGDIELFLDSELLKGLIPLKERDKETVTFLFLTLNQVHSKTNKQYFTNKIT